MAEHQFKPGDKVRFIKHVHNNACGNLSRSGKIYTVYEAFFWDDGGPAISLVELEMTGGSPSVRYGISLDWGNEIVSAGISSKEDMEALYG